MPSGNQVQDGKGKTLHLGILGCSQIVPRSIMQPLKGIEAIVPYGIASRNIENAAAYAAKYGIPHVYETYQALLDDRDIDFVYVALPNHLHQEWVVKAARAGKHLLVEKPLCITLAELREMQAACRQNKVYLLEGLMVQHHPWQEYLKAAIKSNQYGKLLSTKSQISFLPKNNFAGNYRSFPEKGGGVFYDLASYWLQFLQCIGELSPVEYNGRSEFNGPNGTDWTFRAEATFATGCHSSFLASFELPYQAWHELEFETAVLKLDDFFRANLGKYKINLEVKDRQTGAVEKVTFPPQCYYTNQLLFFYDVITGAQPNIDLEESVQRHIWLEKIYCQARLAQAQGNSST